MNEYQPDPAQAAGEAYYDRSTGLMVFGVMTILLGALAALLAVITLAGMAVASTLPNAQQQVSLATVIPGTLLYVGLAVALTWLGIGSFQARRWARALLLIFSWTWLLGGLIDIVVLAFVMPRVMANLPTPAGAAQPVPQGTLFIIMIITILMTGFFMVVLPGIWLFFYSSRHVKLTCEWRDPVVRWTDLCPLPVLALCLWLGFSAFMMLTMNAMPYLAAPFFGMFVSGMAARAVYMAMGLISAYAAWLLYRLDTRGWWLALAAFLLFAISATITYSLHDITELYQLMHYPEVQLEQIRKTGLLKGSMMAWFTPICMLPLLGYMIFIKKYLR